MLPQFLVNHDFTKYIALKTQIKHISHFSPKWVDEIGKEIKNHLIKMYFLNRILEFIQICSKIKSSSQCKQTHIYPFCRFIFSGFF